MNPYLVLTNETIRGLVVALIRGKTLDLQLQTRAHIVGVLYDKLAELGETALANEIDVFRDYYRNYPEGDVIPSLFRHFGLEGCHNRVQNSHEFCKECGSLGYVFVCRLVDIDDIQRSHRLEQYRNLKAEFEGGQPPKPPAPDIPF